MIGLTVLFLIPIYYLAKSKGYNALPVCIVCGAVGFITPLALHVFLGEDLFPFADCTAALGALVVVWLLPAKKGAPGKAYLKITFNCPECKTSVTFKRHEEGTAQLCPACGEIITVPLDEFSPKTAIHKARNPAPIDGMRCFETYANEVKALEVKALLEGNGIPAEIVSDAGGGMLPQIGISQGYNVMVKTEDWDRAIETAGTTATATTP